MRTCTCTCTVRSVRSTSTACAAAAARRARCACLNYIYISFSWSTRMHAVLHVHVHDAHVHTGSYYNTILILRTSISRRAHLKFVGRHRLRWTAVALQCRGRAVRIRRRDFCGPSLANDWRRRGVFWLLHYLVLAVIISWSYSVCSANWS